MESASDHENGYVAPPKDVNERFLFPEGQDRNTFDSTLDHLSSRCLQQTLIRAHGTQQDLVIVLHAQSRERVHDLREKWVGNIRYHQAENTTAARYQGPRVGVWIVALFFDHSAHSPG